MTVKMDVHRDATGHIKVNPSWLFQFALAAMIAIIGYFVDAGLEDIKSELEFSRIERAQIRADLTSFQIGAAGDRFTQTEWNDERDRIEVELDNIRERLARLESGK